MAVFTWFDGNQGAYRYLDFERYDTEMEDDGSAISGVYNGRDGDLDETRQPARFHAEVKEAEVAEDDEGNLFHLEGVITKITFYNSSDEKTLVGRDLDLSAAEFAAHILADEPWSIEGLFKAFDLELIGADDGGNPGGWDGDDIFTGQGDDIVTANGGDDYIKDEGGTDHYDGGEGWDELSYDQLFWNPWMGKSGIKVDLGKGEVRGPDGNVDTVENIEGVRGTFRKDSFIGDSGDNSFMGLQGRDTFDGKGGFDQVRYHRDADQGGMNGVVVNLAKGFARDGFGQRDTLKNIEGARGTDFDDVFTDSRKDNYFDGREGDDTFIFSKGDDWASGRGGDDLFRYKGKKFGDNGIDDFDIGSDQIRIDKAKRFGQLDIENNDDGDAVVSYAKGSITLVGVSADDLSASDFIF